MTPPLILCHRPCAAKRACLPVENQGQIYQCAHALAAAYEVTVGAVYQALHRTGSTRCLGNIKGRGNHRKPLRVGPHQWPSYTAAANELGIDRSLIGKLLRNDPERLLGLVMKKKNA